MRTSDDAENPFNRRTSLYEVAPVRAPIGFETLQTWCGRHRLTRARILLTTGFVILRAPTRSASSFHQWGDTQVKRCVYLRGHLVRSHHFEKKIKTRQQFTTQPARTGPCDFGLVPRPLKIRSRYRRVDQDALGSWSSGRAHLWERGVAQHCLRVAMELAGSGARQAVPQEHGEAGLRAAGVRAFEPLSPDVFPRRVRDANLGWVKNPSESLQHHALQSFLHVRSKSNKVLEGARLLKALS